MLRTLLKYSKNIVELEITPEYKPALTTFIIMVKDLNVSVVQERSLSDFILNEFNLYHIETFPSTLGNYI